MSNHSSYVTNPFVSFILMDIQRASDKDKVLFAWKYPNLNNSTLCHMSLMITKKRETLGLSSFTQTEYWLE